MVTIVDATLTLIEAIVKDCKFLAAVFTKTLDFNVATIINLPQ